MFKHTSVVASLFSYLPAAHRSSCTAAILALLLLCSGAMLAQEPAAAGTAVVVTAASAGERIRFLSSANVCQIRVQILLPAGASLFDSQWKDGNVFDWTVESAGQPLTSGSYRCVVTVRDLDGQMTRKEATVTVQDGRLSLEPHSGAGEMTIVGSDGNAPKITFLAHDGETGSVVNTAGDLSFRLGDFLGGKDVERMRLTAEGSLGIGTDKPLAPLDVNGLIRTSKGIMFSDGSILSTAVGLPGAEVTATTTRQPSPPTAGPLILRGPLAPLQPSSAARLLPRTSSGPDYQFKVDAAGVHIGTTSAFGLDVAGNVSLASDLALPATSAASAGVVTLGGTSFLHAFGTGNTFLGAGAGNFTMSASDNTATGFQALASNTIGNANTASGYQALSSNTNGAYNVADGYLAMGGNDSGQQNVATGYRALFSNTAGSYNTAVGFQSLYFNASSYDTAVGNLALFNNTTGYNNTATGYRALFNTTIGPENTATGYEALLNNVSGSANTATGDLALFTNSNGYDNTADGFKTLYSNISGGFNTASGYLALTGNTTGFDNTADGYNALSGNTTANSNIGIGYYAGSNLTTGGDNIDIGNNGIAAETSTIRIGAAQLRTFIAGIRGVTTGSGAIPVLIDANGQLGTTSSSRRYKFDIADIGDLTDSLMRLRPVTFRYIAQGADAPLQYGLIAEEVAEVYPELVTRDKDGQVETVMYQFLAPMLLNEVQKQQRRISAQQTTIEQQHKAIEALTAAVSALGERLQRVELQSGAVH